jgi:hypothetical protein
MNRSLFFAFIFLLGCSSSADLPKQDSSQEKSTSSDETPSNVPIKTVADLDAADWDHPPIPGKDAKTQEKTAGELYQEIQKSEDEELQNAAIFDKYKRSWLRVTGVVNFTYPTAYSLNPWETRTRINFRVPEKLGGLDCLLKNNSPTWEQFGPGATVTIEGVLSLWGDLRECRVIEFEDKPYPFLSVDEVMKDYESAQNRFDSQVIRVRGTLAAIDQGKRELALESEDGKQLTVLCDSRSFGTISAEDIAVGDIVDVLGSLSSASATLQSAELLRRISQSEASR